MNPAGEGYGGNQHRKPRSQRPGPPQHQQYDQYGGSGGYGYYPQQGGPQLFEDMSVGGQYGAPPNMAPGPNPGVYGGFNPSQIMNDPLANAAMQYGQTLVGQGKDIVDQKLEKYVSISRLKYFFAVDTGYVIKKLRLLLLPFTNSDWSVKYNLDEPIAPRYEVNSPDLYIPLMAFCTYILVAGIVLGVQNRFGPEQLGIVATSALGWLALEVVLIMILFYIFNMSTKLSTFHVVAFLSYKYVGMVGSLSAFLLLSSLGYYTVLAYSSFSLAYFLLRAMRTYMPTEGSSGDSFTVGLKRRRYMVFGVAIIQPLLMLYLTSYLTVRYSPPLQNGS